MTSKERLDLFTKGQKVDRRPNLTIVGSVVTQYNGITVEEYCKDWKKMAEGAIACARDCGLDYVQIASDLLREAEGYGTQIEFFPNKLPQAVKFAMEDISEVENMRSLKCREIPRLYDLVLATAYVAETVDEIYPMTICDGPVTVAANIRGTEDMILDMYDRPELVDKLLMMVTETSLDFIDELAAAGSKYVYIPDPVASIVGPEIYGSMVLKYHRMLFARMKEHGIYGRLHMCGDTSTILPFSSQSGAGIIDVDHAVDFSEALKSVEGRCIINGNIDPVSDVYLATEQHVYDSIMELGRNFGDRKCMFMPGCELPTTTKLENVRAITRALESIGC